MQSWTVTCSYANLDELLGDMPQPKLDCDMDEALNSLEATSNINQHKVADDTEAERIAVRGLSRAVREVAQTMHQFVRNNSRNSGHELEASPHYHKGTCPPRTIPSPRFSTLVSR